MYTISPHFTTAGEFVAFDHGGWVLGPKWLLSLVLCSSEPCSSPGVASVPCPTWASSVPVVFASIHSRFA